MRLSIIIPVFNEEHLVSTLLTRVVSICLEKGIEKEIIVVNDGSSDSTGHVVNQFAVEQPAGSIRVIHHEKNQGKGAAVRTGMAAASGDILIIQDADLEYDPEEIPEVIRPIATGECDVVYGSRILREKALKRSGLLGLITGKHPHSYVLAYLGGVTVTKWINLLTGAGLTDEPTCYKCFRHSVLEDIVIESNDFAWEPEITVKLLMRGVEIHEVPISYHPRKNNDGKKINWKDGVKALRTALKYRFPRQP